MKTQGPNRSHTALVIFVVIVGLGVLGWTMRPPFAGSVRGPKIAKNTCLNNLRQIYAAKKSWRLSQLDSSNRVPTKAEIAAYLKAGVFPECPSGGIYTIGDTTNLPTCSYPGHKL